MNRERWRGCWSPKLESTLVSQWILWEICASGPEFAAEVLADRALEHLSAWSDGSLDRNPESGGYV